MNQPTERRVPEDEIDLQAIGNRLGTALIYPFKLLRQHLLTTFLFVLTAVLVAVAAKYVLPKTYKASFIIRPNDKGEKFHLWVFNDIQRLIKEDDVPALMRELQLDESTVRGIARIDLFNPFVKERSDSVNYTEVSIVTTNPGYILQVQSALLNYLENIPYFKKIKTLQKSQIKMNLEQVNKDLKQLDSLKRLQLSHYGQQQVPGGGQILMNELINPTATYSMTADRMNKKSALLAQEIFYDNFQLVKGCVVGKHHHFPPRILFMCAVLVPLFLIVCFFYLHFKTRKKILIN